MARFVRVQTYPQTGWPDRLTDWDWSYPSPALDALVRACRPITELYSEALATLDYVGHRSTLYVVPRLIHVPTSAAVEVSIDERLPYDIAGEYGFIDLPADIEPLSVPARAQLMLQAVHRLTQHLCEVRGWPTAALAHCRQHVEAHEFIFTWASPWKTSPDRRRQARVEYRLTPVDGWGYASLTLRDRASHEILGVSSAARADSWLKGFKRSAATLRWHTSEHVSVKPYPGGSDVAWTSGLIEARFLPELTFILPEPVPVRQPSEDWAADNTQASVVVPEVRARES